MPVPEFLKQLRAKIGHDPAWLPAVTVIVLRELGNQTEVLLQLRSDLNVWGPPGGIIEPGEDVDQAAVREVEEETGIAVRFDHLIWIFANEPFTYPNGDQVQYLELVAQASYVDGDVDANNDETLDVRWWPIDELPPLSDLFQKMIKLACQENPATCFGKNQRCH